MRNQTTLAAFLSSNTGRRFFNIFYSVGASIVIVGALFKILHFPGANIMLMVGMITEALVFFISAFDDSQAGISSSSRTEDDEDDIDDYIPRQKGAIVSNLPLSPEYTEKMSQVTQNMDQFATIMSSLNEVSSSLLASYQEINNSSQNVSTNTQGFSQNIKSLNENVTGLNDVYAAQLKSLKDQIDAVRLMNDSLQRIRTMFDSATTDSASFREETEKMTKQIQALNNVYARLLQAMSGNNTPPPVY